jgi:hypothetical protein
MGKLLARFENPDQAVDTFRHALSLREQLAASFEEENWQRELEAAYRRTSELILSMGRAPEALETAEQYLLATSLAPDQRADKPERVARALGPCAGRPSSPGISTEHCGLAERQSGWPHGSTGLSSTTRTR